MAKTLILGNNEFSNCDENLREVTTLQVTTSSINNEAEIVEFIKSNIPTDLDRIIININEIETALALHIALRIRLMIFCLKRTSLSAIILVSESSFETMVDYSVSSILLMTKGVYLVNQEELAIAIENTFPITPTQYVSEFLNLIKIQPKEAVEGRHSIANEWGVVVLSEVITSGVKSEFIPLQASSSLYFMYCSVIALNVGDIDKIINDRPRNFLFENLKITDNFNYLLIDDEAQKGWGDVLKILMPNAFATICDKKAMTYEDLPQDIRKQIEVGEFDIIFLDLRMNGVEEESIINPEEFSGMKILNGIKEINPGIQVIMLTATNKGWNVQAMLYAGANGYYMKESPEYHFPLKYSEQNAKSLHNTILECLDNSYLQDVYKEIRNVSIPTDLDISDDIIEQLKLAFGLIIKAKSYTEIAFSYIALEQVLEICTSYFITKIWVNNCYEYIFTENSDRCYNYNEDNTFDGYLIKKREEKEVPQWKKIVAIYYQLFEGVSNDFASKIRKLIDLRNQYIHKKNVKITKDDFQDLFDEIIKILSVIK